MSEYILLIIGMMLVTYIPRLLPFLLISNKEIPEKLRKFLQYIPYTALGALIIPGVFTATNMPVATFLGIGFALIYAWYKGGIIIPVLGSIIITFVILIM